MNLQTLYKNYINIKNKYNDLDIQMNGGGKPRIFNLKNINGNYTNIHIEKHLNPIYGFIFAESRIINNFIKFRDSSPLSDLINTIFFFW